MGVQKHQQLCSFNELSRSGGSRARSCQSPSPPAVPWEQSRHALMCPRHPCPRGALAPAAPCPLPTTARGEDAPKQSPSQPGCFCSTLHQGASRREARRLPQAQCNGDDAAPSYPCPMGPPLCSSLGACRGSGTRADPMGPTGSAPPGPAVGVPEPAPGPWLGPAGAALEPGEPAALPLPGRVLGYRNLLKYFSPPLAGPSKFGAYSFTLWASGTSEAV